jgi:tyrosine-protein kinase Etk/Wzc
MSKNWTSSDKLTQSIAVTEAGQRRLFFERQLQQAKKDLADAEVALKVTQEKTGLIMLDSQGRAIIEAVATLRGQIAAKEVELRAMRTFATENNSEYVRTQQQLAALRTELTKLERAQISGAGDVLLPTGKVPEAGLEYLRKLREVKYNETGFELLAKQFEIAKLDEVKDAGLIQALDSAIAPDKKSKPHRAVIVAFATLVAALVGVVWAMLREARERANADPLRTARFAALLSYASFRRRQRN